MLGEVLMGRSCLFVGSLRGRCGAVVRSEARAKAERRQSGPSTAPSSRGSIWMADLCLNTNCRELFNNCLAVYS